MSEVTAIAHPNFALIKYWGKADSIQNFPAMSSLSLTIDTLASTTKISQQRGTQENVWELNGERQPNLGQILPTLNYLSKLVRLVSLALYNQTITFQQPRVLRRPHRVWLL